MRSSLAPLVLLAVLPIACEPDPDIEPTIGTWNAPDAPLRTTVLPASGVAPVRVAVRAEGSLGAAVPGDVAGITVDGVVVETKADGGGVAVVMLDDSGVHDVSADNSETVAVFDAPVGIDRMPRSLAQDTLAEVHSANGGAIGRSESQVWWIPTDGEPISVMDVSGTALLTGSAAGGIDADGLTDAVVWFGGSIAVLRGHPVAGHVLVGTIDSDARQVAHATLGDADGDGLTDIVIAWAEAPRFELEVWRGDGAFGFEADEPVRLRNEPYSVSIGRNIGSVTPQITVLDDTQFWARFVPSGGTYVPTGPQFETPPQFLAGSTSESADINGDGADELFIFGPVVSGVGRDIRWYDLAGSAEVFAPSQGTLGARVDLADSDRDGHSDFWMAQETGELFLRRVRADVQEQRSVWQIPDHGPIAVRDQNADGVPEVFAGGDTTWDTAIGGLVDIAGVTWWGVNEREVVIETGFTTAPVIVRRDDVSARIDAIGLAETGPQVDLVVIALFTGASPVMSELTRTAVSSSGADAVDVAVCGDIAYALSTAELTIVRLDAAGAVQLGQVAVSGGAAVACGEGPGTATVGVLKGTGVDLFTDAGVVAGSEVVAGAVELALVGGAVETCAEAGCSLGALADGTLVRSEGGQITVGDIATPGSGAVRVGDFDDDGGEEVVIYGLGDLVLIDDAGDQRVVRGRGHSVVDVDGQVVPVDLFADGRLVLVGSRDGDIVASTGTTPVPEPTEAEPTEDD